MTKNRVISNDENMKQPTSDTHGEKRYFLAVVLISSLFCLFFSKIDLSFTNSYSFSDIGHQLYNYKMTFLGEVLYRDFWENWTPGTFYLNAFAFKLFGVSIYSTKLLLAIFMAISSIALYLISKNVVPKPIALAISFVSLLWGNFTLNIPYSGWFSNCFGLLALLGFIQYCTSKKWKMGWLALTGLALGMTFTFKQNVGSLSLVAIATAVAVSVHMGDEINREKVLPKSEDSGSLEYLIIAFEVILLLFSYLVFPYFFLRTIHRAGLKLDVSNLFVFYVPVLAINTVILVFFINAMRRANDISARQLFLELFSRELALAIGFAIPVVPWFVYFSELIGWKDFYRIVSLTHPVQESFKNTYPKFGQLPPLSAVSASVFLILLLICGIIVYFFVAATSKKRLYIASAILAGVLIMIGFRISPILQTLGPLYYFNSFLAVVLVVGMGARYRLNLFSSGTPKETFLIFAVAIFSVYNFFGLSAFVDNNHYQMVIFPWLLLMGYVFYVMYYKGSSLLLSPQFEPRWRRAGILASVALPFLLLYVGKSGFGFYRQYLDNAKYCEEVSRDSGKQCESVLKKMSGEGGGIYINSALLDQIDGIVERIRKNTKEDDYVLVVPSTGVFNFLANRRSPTKYRYFLFDFISQEQQTELLGELRRKRPAYIILDTGLSANLYRETLLLVYHYMGNRYNLEKVIGRFYIFKRDAKGV